MFDLDALLRLLDRRGASELHLAAGAPPCLLTGSDRSPLALPPIQPAFLAALTRELMGPDRAASLLAGEGVSFAYRVDSLGSFDITVQPPADQPQVVVRPEVERIARTLDPDVSAFAPEQGLAVPDAMRETLEFAARAGASDVHFGDGAPVVMRVGGLLQTLPGAPAGRKPVRPMVERMLTPVGRRRLADGLAVDFSFGVDGVGRCRGNVYQALRGYNLAVRILPETVPSLRELRLPGSLAELVDVANGLVLFTGPTGSGKSATMAALVDHINRSRPAHLITLEDPIEFVHQRARALVRQREVGVHVGSFAEGLRDALREDPDVILVGEMRDPETIALALTAAETGHLVISTLHSNRAPSAVERIVDVFPAHRQTQVRLQVAESLRAVVAQRLLRAADGSGRIPAVEVLRNNKAVANHIRERRIHQVPSVMQTSRESGMWVLERHLAALFKRGMLDESMARLHCDDDELFDSYVRSL